jgi:hypothetical protein
VDHPALKKLADAGEIEIHEEGHTPPKGGGGGRIEPSGAPGHTTTSGGHRSGDR